MNFLDRICLLDILCYIAENTKILKCGCPFRVYQNVFSEHVIAVAANQTNKFFSI